VYLDTKDKAHREAVPDRLCAYPQRAWTRQWQRVVVCRNIAIEADNSPSSESS